jgi:peptidylprolyl isomerase
MTFCKTTTLSFLVLVCSSSLFAQSTQSTHTAARHPPVRKSTTAKTTCPESAVTNPPGAPAVTGPVQTLYALRYVDTKIGTGELAAPGKIYSVHYTGWLTDGTKFDSSVDRGQPIEFPQGQRRVIPGWDTGFDGMHVGGKRRLYIPYQLAYGENGKGPIPAKAALVFDVELVSQRDLNAPAPQSEPARPAPMTPPRTSQQPQ